MKKLITPNSSLTKITVISPVYNLQYDIALPAFRIKN